MLINHSECTVYSTKPNYSFEIGLSIARPFLVKLAHREFLILFSSVEILTRAKLVFFAVFPMSIHRNEAEQDDCKC